MKTSLAWLNSYLAPRVTSAEEAERLLTFAGFPLESITALDGVNAGDHLLDVEVTSNRGDCLSHIGLAREIAAASVRMLNMPVAAPEAKGPETGELVALANQVHEACPRFTLRVIRGVKIGPSPAWMQKALTAIGLRPINNVVDVTNFVQHELGSPSHVFDMAKLAKAPDGKPAVIIRKANPGEKLTLLDGKTIELKPSDVVVADAREAVSLAGIMGGGPSGVSDSTTDVLVEVATWDPATIRTTARRLNLRTDASHRFERVVDARTIAAASNRICELILQTAGGELSKTLLAAGAEMKPLETIMLRHARVNQVLGADFTDAQITTALEAQGFKDGAQPVSPTHKTAESASYRVTVPAHRPDVRLEIDLIEEVGRTIGYDKLAIPDKLPVRVSAVQTTELASRELARVLTGAGFYETVTFSFINKKQAAPFLPPGMNLLAVSEDRRGEDNIVRPGIIPSLMLCRRANQAARVSVDGGVRLYEFASVYAEMTPAKKGEQGATVEHRNLGLLADVVAGPGMKAAEARQHAVRLMRGVIDQLVRATVGVGHSARLTVEPGKVPFAALDPAASAGLMLDGKPFGWFGVIGASTQAQSDLETPVVAAEVNVPVLLEAFPPRSDVHLLPTFPAVERDLSLIVDERTPWAKVEAALTAAAVEQLESWRFVGVYRGQPLAVGKKSVTFRMIFRDEAKTLRDDEVNARVETLVGRLKSEIPLEIRTA
ncbi:MAG: phenylalanine--tRNA ligase subunit beta [Phycisphaerales bacterium]